MTANQAAPAMDVAQIAQDLEAAGLRRANHPIRLNLGFTFSTRVADALRGRGGFELYQIVGGCYYLGVREGASDASE